MNVDELVLYSEYPGEKDRKGKPLADALCAHKELRSYIEEMSDEDDDLDEAVNRMLGWDEEDINSIVGDGQGIPMDEWESSRLRDMTKVIEAYAEQMKADDPELGLYSGEINPDKVASCNLQLGRIPWGDRPIRETIVGRELLPLIGVGPNEGLVKVEENGDMSVALLGLDVPVVGELTKMPRTWMPRAGAVVSFHTGVTLGGYESLSRIEEWEKEGYVKVPLEPRKKYRAMISLWGELWLKEGGSMTMGDVYNALDWRRHAIENIKYSVVDRSRMVLPYAAIYNNNTHDVLWVASEPGTPWKEMFKTIHKHKLVEGERPYLKSYIDKCANVDEAEACRKFTKGYRISKLPECSQIIREWSILPHSLNQILTKVEEEANSLRQELLDYGLGNRFKFYESPGYEQTRKLVKEVGALEKSNILGANYGLWSHKKSCTFREYGTIAFRDLLLETNTLRHRSQLIESNERHIWMKGCIISSYGVAQVGVGFQVVDVTDSFKKAKKRNMIQKFIDTSTAFATGKFRPGLTVVDLNLPVQSMCKIYSMNKCRRSHGFSLRQVLKSSKLTSAKYYYDEDVKAGCIGLAGATFAPHQILVMHGEFLCFSPQSPNIIYIDKEDYLEQIGAVITYIYGVYYGGVYMGIDARGRIHCKMVAMSRHLSVIGAVLASTRVYYDGKDVGRRDSIDQSTQRDRMMTMLARFYLGIDC